MIKNGLALQVLRPVQCIPKWLDDYNFVIANNPVRRVKGHKSIKG